LGAGGIGVWRGKVTQLGPSRISASIVNGRGQASVRVVSAGFAGKGGPATLDATYSIAAGSRITRVDATITGAVPDMIAGLIRHPGVELVSGRTDHWAFAGTWGNQSLAKDDLGMVLFYRHDRAEVQVGDTDISIHFCNPKALHYAFAAAWSQEAGGLRTRQAFEAWAMQVIAQFERTDHEVKPAMTCSMDH
ncbi:MAG TPA: DUF4861 family protein, partial [Sphingomicrobium sp.]|nr:DUF4861 family protein [Sphingomicrobium sp.]